MEHKLGNLAKFARFCEICFWEVIRFFVRKFKLRKLLNELLNEM